MIIASKQDQVNKIKQYIESNATLYSKCIIFGKCTRKEGTSNDYLGVAVYTINDAMADDDEALFDLFCTVDDITEGKFDLSILNSINSRNLQAEIEKGEVIYG